MFYILWALYIFLYWNNDTPPIYDILSPTGTILMCVIYTIYAKNGNISMSALSVLLGALGDFMMNDENIEISLLFFSFSHMLKFFSYYNSELNMFYVYSYISQLITMYNLCKFRFMKGYIAIFIMYQLPLLFQNKKITASVILYAISDILIGYNMLYYINYRKIRVLVVPALYWTSEFLYLSSL